MIEEERIDDERRRAAYHEAGHVVSAYLLGLRVELVTVKPGRTWSGACLTAPTRLAAEGLRYEAPVIMQPTRLRLQIEKLIVHSLAGRIGEELAGYFPVGYNTEPEEERAAAKLVEATTLTPAQREMLQRGDDDQPFRTDDESACALAWTFAARDEAAAFLNLLRCSARVLVYTERFRQLVGVLVPALLMHETLTGGQVRQLLRQAEAR